MQRFFNYREGEIMYSNVYKGIHLTFEEQINLSAHNHNIVDIEFTTKPKIQI